MADEVLVDFRKWGGGEHWAFRLERLGEDEHGVWLGGRPGNVTVRSPRGAHEFKTHHLMLIPRGTWWVASFNEPPTRSAIYVDVTTPPVWDGDVVTMTDLDLDVILGRDGAAFLEDEDEFEEHRIAFGYPDDVVTTARATADAVLDAIGARAEPFGAVGPAWLEKLVAGELPAPAPPGR